MKKKLFTKAIFISSLCIIIQIFSMQPDDKAIVPNPHPVHQQPNLEKKVERYRLYSKSVKQLNTDLEEKIIELKTEIETLRCGNEKDHFKTKIKLADKASELFVYQNVANELLSQREDLKQKNFMLIQTLEEYEEKYTELQNKYNTAQMNYLTLETRLKDRLEAVVSEMQVKVQDALTQTKEKYENQIQSLTKTKTNAQFNNKLLITTLFSSWFFFIIYFLKTHNLTEIIITNITTLWQDLT